MFAFNGLIFTQNHETELEYNRLLSRYLQNTFLEHSSLSRGDMDVSLVLCTGEEEPAQKTQTVIQMAECFLPLHVFMHVEYVLKHETGLQNHVRKG
jgi:hypothetical protein